MEKVRELVPKTDPILKEKIPKFDFSNPPIDPVELAHILTQTMLQKNGLGLSAPQIGLPYRAFVIRSNPIICCFNPFIVDRTSDMVYLDEGCLTFPNLFVKIKRPSAIKIRYTEPNGNVVTNKYTGMTSRAIQHECDHLEGILFTTRANSYHLEQSRKKLKKYEKQF